MKQLQLTILFLILSLVVPCSSLAQGHIDRPTSSTTPRQSNSPQRQSNTRQRQNNAQQRQQQQRQAELQRQREEAERQRQVEIQRQHEEEQRQTELQRQREEAERQRQAEEERVNEIIQNLINNMVRIEGGTFTMGATREQKSPDKDEKPKHQVTLSSFSIGKYEVTQEEWEAVMGNNPSRFKGAKRPVEMVMWNDCQEFIRRLNQKTGRNFRFPTEAEWEYAARGGNRSKGYKYAGSNILESVAWFKENSGGETHPVGTKAPNELGLYDMTGNVREWCSDWYGRYSSSSQNNPSGPLSGYSHVNRGCSFSNSAWACRVTVRNYISIPHSDAEHGLRLAL